MLWTGHDGSDGSTGRFGTAWWVPYPPTLVSGRLHTLPLVLLQLRRQIFRYDGGGGVLQCPEGVGRGFGHLEMANKSLSATPIPTPPARLLLP